MSIPITPLTGCKFGRLRTLASPFVNKDEIAVVNTACDCGTEKIIRVEHLRNGRVKSCGCLAREVSGLLSDVDAEGNLKRTARREYRAFNSAVQRCVNPKAHKYETCGGVGIKIHPEWVGNFPAFYHDLGPAAPGQILVRRNLREDYTPSNCKWGTWADFGESIKARRLTTHLSELPLAA